MLAPRTGTAQPLPPCVDRPLDTTEALFHSFNSCRVCLTGAVALVEGPLDAELVSRAIAHVQDRHPVLRSRIVEDAAGPRFVPGDGAAPPLRVLGPFDDARPAALLAREIHDPHVSGAPPYRCTFAPARGPGLHAIALGASHAAADGRSFHQILADVVDTAGALREGRPLAALLPAGPTLERGLPRVTLAARLRHALKRHLRHGPSPLSVIRPSARAGPGERRSRVLLGATAPVVAALRARCREERTTVEGALTAALLDALRPFLGALRRISISHQASLRDACRPPIPPEQIGCFVAGTYTRHALGPGGRFWDAARSTTRQLRAWRASGLGVAAARASSGRVRLVADHLAASAADPGSLGRVSIAGLSNCGALAPPSGPFAIRELYVGTGHHVVGDLLELLVTTVDERLTCTLVAVEPLVPADAAERVLDAFLERVGAAAGPDARRDAPRRAPSDRPRRA